MKIGVLSLQGNFKEHIQVFKKLNVESIEVRELRDFEKISGLVIPGGESTSIYNLLKINSLLEKMNNLIKQDFPIFGTCAGLVLLSKFIEPETSLVRPLNALDLKVNRNFFGSQKYSFESLIQIKENNFNFKGIFIRAPQVIEVGKNTEVIATFEYKNSILPVAFKKKSFLATAFHPELSNDDYFHRLFLESV